jgi:hypothetical protein
LIVEGQRDSTRQKATQADMCGEDGLSTVN